MSINKVCLVTGGCSGLGLATAQKFAGKGYTLALFDMNEAEGPKAAKALGNNSSFYKVDVTNEAQVKSAVEQVVATHKRIDVLVNSAGISLVGLVVNRKGVVGNTKTFQKVLEVNVIGTFNVAKYVALAMTTQEPVGDYKQRGVIINVGSVAGDEGQNGQTYYAASKGAIHAMSLPMARDLGKWGIRVVAIAPGIIRTPMGNAMPEKVTKTLVDATALGRFGEADEFADTVWGICGSTYMTGNVVRMDGGIKFPKL